MKIVYIVPALDAKGGRERIIIEKANYLADYFGFEVSIIICNYQNSRLSYSLSDSVELVHLDLPHHLQYRYKYPKRLWLKRKYNQDLSNALTKTTKQMNPDIIIGTGNYKADLVSTLNSNAKKIIECHVTRDFILGTNYQTQPLYSRFFRWFYKKFYLTTVERHADVVVTLTANDKELWKKAQRVEVIPNFSNIQVQRLSDCASKKVIAVGRLRGEKGFDRLIEIWKLVGGNHPDWHLDIFGDGEQKEYLEQQIRANNINNITLCGNTENISKEYASSSICVVTSYSEAFSLTILEAMKHGVPCVAFDCPFGPRQIIANEKSGFIVENGDLKSFARKLSQLMEDYDLRKQMSSASIERAKIFNTDEIMLQWKNLFLSIL